MGQPAYYPTFLSNPYTSLPNQSVHAPIVINSNNVHDQE